MSDTTLTEKIIDLEWQMFHNVENRGGKADCQQTPETFRIMRKSQFLSWSKEVAASYYYDLIEAQKSGRNLCAEKYAFMMEFTYPDEYRYLKQNLPEVNTETMSIIQDTVKIHLEWESQADQKYPNLRGKGRPLSKEYDSPLAVSVETYLLCEMKTYSLKTIQLLNKYTHLCLDKGINLAEKILEYTIKQYGFSSLNEAEAVVSQY